MNCRLVCVYCRAISMRKSLSLSSDQLSGEIHRHPVNRPGEAVRRVVIVRHRFAEVVAAAPPTYHALELKMERRFAQGLALRFNSTRSKSIDNVGENASINKVYCFSCDRSISYLDTGVLHPKQAPMAYIKSGYLLPLTADGAETDFPHIFFTVKSGCWCNTSPWPTEG